MTRSNLSSGPIAARTGQAADAASANAEVWTRKRRRDTADMDDLPLIWCKPRKPTPLRVTLSATDGFSKERSDSVDCPIRAAFDGWAGRVSFRRQLDFVG